MNFVAWDFFRVLKLFGFVKTGYRRSIILIQVPSRLLYDHTVSGLYPIDGDRLSNLEKVDHLKWSVVGIIIKVMIPAFICFDFDRELQKSCSFYLLHHSSNSKRNIVITPINTVWLSWLYWLKLSLARLLDKLNRLSMYYI